MERSTGDGHHLQHIHHHQHYPQQFQHRHVHHTPHTPYMIHTPNLNYQDYQTVKNRKIPPRLKTISRSISMAVDNYNNRLTKASSAEDCIECIDDSTLIVEQPLIHGIASSVALRSSLPPQTLALSKQLHTRHSMAENNRLHSSLHSSRAEHMHSFAHLTPTRAGMRHRPSQSSFNSTSSNYKIISPTLIADRGIRPLDVPCKQSNVFLLSSGSLGDDIPDDSSEITSYKITSPVHSVGDLLTSSATHISRADQNIHSMKKNVLRRSDTIDVQPISTFQVKKTHSFHAPSDSNSSIVGDSTGLSHAVSMGNASTNLAVHQNSTLRSNFLLPGTSSVNDIRRSPLPKRRGYRSHHSFHENDQRAKNKKIDSLNETQVRHSSLNDDFKVNESLDLMSQTNISLENEIFITSHSNSHMKINEMESSETHIKHSDTNRRQNSGSREEAYNSPSNTAYTNLCKRDKKQTHRQHSAHSLEIDCRPSFGTESQTILSGHKTGNTVSDTLAASESMNLHKAATAAKAVCHFKHRKYCQSLYLSPSNLQASHTQLPHRSSATVLTAAAAFQRSDCRTSDLNKAKAMHSASMRLRMYREALSASKKSKSFMIDDKHAVPVDNNEFDLTTSHRRSGKTHATIIGTGGNISTSNPLVIDTIQHSPHPLNIFGSSSPNGMPESDFVENKHSPLTYETNENIPFKKVLQPFKHKTTDMVTASTSGQKLSLINDQKNLTKKSLSEETYENEVIERKRKRIVCIVMTVFLCLACASVLVVIMTLTHSSSSSTSSHMHPHSVLKKTYTYNRDVPVHYNVRQENERLMKETMERGRYNKNFTEMTVSLESASSSTLSNATHYQRLNQKLSQQQQQQQQQPQIVRQAYYNHQQRQQQHYNYKQNYEHAEEHLPPIMTLLLQQSNQLNNQQ